MPLFLREWREAHSLTLEQLGNKLGQHLTTVQKWEKGRNLVSMNDLERLAAIYGVHPSALFFHPDDRDAAERLNKAHDVLRRMTPAEAEQWIATGKMMAREG